MRMFFEDPKMTINTFDMESIEVTTVSDTKGNGPVEGAVTAARSGKIVLNKINSTAVQNIIGFNFN